MMNISKFESKSIFILLAFFAIAWLSFLVTTVPIPPFDNIEQLVWMRSMEWGYFKHPPLTTWLMWPFVQIFGWNKWASYLLGASCTIASLGIFWNILRQAKGPHFAGVALLIAMCITYYNGSLFAYNHNISLTLLVAITAWIWWKLIQEVSLTWWLALGIITAFGMLTKYQYALTLFVGAYLFIKYGMWKIKKNYFYIAIAGLLTIVILTPHLIWLSDQKAGPLQYAASVLSKPYPFLQRMEQVFYWLIDIFFNRCLAAMILLGFIFFYTRKNKNTEEEKNNISVQFILAWGLTPILLMAMMGGISGNYLPTRWGTAFAMWMIPLLMLSLSIQENKLTEQHVIKKITISFVIIQIMLIFLSLQTSIYGFFPSKNPKKIPFPYEQMHTEMLHVIHSLTDCPIDVISGPIGQSGALAIAFNNHPKVLIEGDLDKSPWIKPNELARSMTLNLWDPDQAPSDAFKTFNGWSYQVQWPTETDMLSKCKK